MLDDGGFLWWAGEAEGVFDKDVLCCAGVRLTIAVLSPYSEQVCLVGVQVPHL